MAWINGPTPPDPGANISAQTSANISTALANSFLNNPNQVTPEGSLTFSPTSDVVTINDPEKPGVQYIVPRYQATQTLSENQEQLRQQREGAQIGLATTANTEAARLQQLLSGNVNLSDAPGLAGTGGLFNTPLASTTFADAGQPQQFLDPYRGVDFGFGDVNPLQSSIGGFGQQQTGFANVGGPASSYAGAGAQQFGFGDAGAQQFGFGATPGSIFGFGGAGDITRNYGPGDFSQDRSNVEQALFQRMQPQLEQDRQRLETQLADQGIRYGSPAYTAAMDNFNRQLTDTRLAITQTAGQEQQRMMDMAAQRAGFQNAAQMQEYQQQFGRGQFFNAAEQQAFAEAQARGTFGNTAQQAAYAQALGRGTFANTAQQAAAAEALARGTFANQAQQAAFSQAQARGTFANEAQRQLYEQILGQGTFANAAQQAAFAQAQARGQFGAQQQAQQYQQALQNAQFVNSAQAAAFAQAQARGQFGNAALTQQNQAQLQYMNAQNQLRNQYLAEQYAARNQPINEISALLSGTQLTQPTWANWNQTQIPTTDVAGLINQNFAQQSANAQMQSALIGNVIGAAGRIASSPAVLSDRRAKNVGERMGTVFAANDDGERKQLPIYEFAYKDDPTSTRHVGPMAQDVERIDPSAVKTIHGVKHIKPDEVMGSILRAA